MPPSPNRLPPVTKELLDFMESLFPDRCPRPDASDRDIWMAVGAVRAVDKLKQLYASQTEGP